MAIALAACGAAAKPNQSTIDLVDKADAAELKRDHATARTLYLEAIATAPDPRSERFARHEFAETLLFWGELAAGAEQLEAITALAPDDAGAWHDLGIVRHHIDDNPGAITALTRARDLAPKDARPRIALAALYWKTGDQASALREYTELYKLDLPGNVRQKVEWAIRQLSAPPPK
jgi:Flp pilus assembly protein TadD